MFALENWDPIDENSPKDKFGNTLFWLNVGSNTEISIKNVVEKIANFVGYHGEIFWDETKPDGTPRKLMDVSKMKEIGWKYSTELEDGIQKTYSWFLENIDTIKEIKL